jgi:spore coat polysaccharide biosynthesis protein SpsF
MSGKPMLYYVVNAVLACDLIDQVFIATSTNSEDDAIARYCKKEGWPVFRGPLSNVAERFRTLIEDNKLENFVRICGDSPLHDPSVIRRGIEIFCSTGCDLATNVNPRTFPKGVSVEVVDAKVFLAASRKISELRHREHPTTYFYDNPNDFRLVNFESGQSMAEISFAVDTEMDYLLITSMLEGMEKDPWKYSLKEKVIRYFAIHQAEQ